MKPIKALKIGIIGASIGLTDATYLNESNTGYFNTLMNGEPLQAVRDVYIDQMGLLFYAIFFGSAFLAFWIKWNNIVLPVLALDVILTVFYSYIPPEAAAAIFLINAIAIGLTLWKALSPSITDG